jgi:hypothetical protein
MSLATLNIAFSQEDTDKIAELEKQLNREKGTIAFLEKELSKVKSQLEKVTSDLPLCIDSVVFASMNKNGSTTYIQYGDTLYDSKIFYLRVRAAYTSYSSRDSVTLSVKIIDPNGNLIRNESFSPKGYTYNWVVYLSRKIASLGGWGNNNNNSFYPGTWRIEFWYNRRCLGHTSFTVYKG